MTTSLKQFSLCSFYSLQIEKSLTEGSRSLDLPDSGMLVFSHSIIKMFWDSKSGHSGTCHGAALFHPLTCWWKLAERLGTKLVMVVMDISAFLVTVLLIERPLETISQISKDFLIKKGREGHSLVARAHDDVIFIGGERTCNCRKFKTGKISRMY